MKIKCLHVSGLQKEFKKIKELYTLVLKSTMSVFLCEAYKFK